MVAAVAEGLPKVPRKRGGLGKASKKRNQEITNKCPGASQSREIWTRILATHTFQPVAARRKFMLQYVKRVQGAGGRAQETLLMASIIHAGRAGAKFAALPWQGGCFDVRILLSIMAIKDIAIWSACMIWELMWLYILHLCKCAVVLFPSGYSYSRTNFVILKIEVLESNSPSLVRFSESTMISCLLDADCVKIRSMAAILTCRS